MTKKELHICMFFFSNPAAGGSEPLSVLGDNILQLLTNTVSGVSTSIGNPLALSVQSTFGPYSLNPFQPVYGVSTLGLNWPSLFKVHLGLILNC